MNSDDYLLGLDIGSSSVKASLVNVRTAQSVASAQSPDGEMPILAVRPGWAEQDPEMWWQHAVASTRQVLHASSIDARSIPQFSK